MCEGELLGDFDPFYQTMFASILNKETEAIYHKDEKERWKWTSLPDATRGRKEMGGGAIDKQRKIYRSYAAHNPVNSFQWHANLQKDEPDKRPVDSIKGFSEI